MRSRHILKKEFQAEDAAGAEMLRQDMFVVFVYVCFKELQLCVNQS